MKIVTRALPESKVIIRVVMKKADVDFLILLVLQIVVCVISSVLALIVLYFVNRVFLRCRTRINDDGERELLQI